MSVDTSTLLEGYRRMLLIRTAENAIAEDFKANKIFSFYHSSVGQEAVAVGTCMALKPGDRVFGNHRSHGHYLAQGGNLYRMFCEIYGKTDGCCGGYGGSMHMLDKSVGFMGTTPILGSILPIALGSAFEQKASGSNRCTLVFVGDGATEEGAFYESLNLAALFKLPIIIVIEDNLFAVNSPFSARRSMGFSWRHVVEGLDCAYFIADGNNFEQMFKSMDVIRDTHVNDGPVVLRAITYRHMAHSGPIMDESVRVYDTLETRTNEDPIDRLEHRFKTTWDIPYLDVRDTVISCVRAVMDKAKNEPEPISQEGKVYAE